MPATGFYEWTDHVGRRQPILFSLAGGTVFYFAGLYSTAEPEGNFVIVTAAANDIIRPVHDRMPFIVAPKDYDAWLNPKSEAYKLVTPSNGNLRPLWVSHRINNSRNESPEAARPLTATVKSVAGGYPLPPGLPEGAAVTILGFSPGYFDVEHNGQQFQVAMPGVQIAIGQ